MILKHIDKMESRFEELKAEILRRARSASACKEQYGRAYGSSSMADLMAVVKDNFDWVCRHGVLTVDLIEAYREEFASHDIFCNVDVERGCLLCDNATVEAYGNATVKACGNATVEAYGNATVKACGNATVEAYGNANVEAYDNATVKACGNATVKAYDNATVKACGNATVKAYGNATVKACGNATVEACGNATVEAYGNANVEAYGNATVKAYDNVYCCSYTIKECKLSGNAIYRVISENAIYYANDEIKFRKQV